MKITLLIIGFTLMLGSVPSDGTILESKNKKITICHIPPGNPSNVHTITISKNALKAHLAHGDFFGNCDGLGGGSGGGI